MATASTPRTRLRRLPARGVHEREAIDAILDEALIAHLGFVDDGHPFVIPTLHARIGDIVYVHGSAASRMIRTLSEGVPACLTVTLLDGIVLARSAFHSSVNYRSVVVLGVARPVEGPPERLRALEAITERLAPGRWAEVRWPTAQELKGTRVLAMTLDETSAKVRTGPPEDDPDDYALPVWAGVIPVHTVAGAPVPDPRAPRHIAPSRPVSTWTPQRRSNHNPRSI
jgi:nitroimidazol reductase NimA-like FMN-containing flavoprotein (pyridoxamine 5'-phosphate oxidase superfamily)